MLDLRLQVIADRHRELVQQQGEGLGVGPHQRLGVVPGLRAAALHEVAGQGEGRAGEAQDRHAGPLVGQLDRPQGRRQIPDGVEVREPLDVGAGAHGVGELRPVALAEDQLPAHGLQGQQDVAEDDPGVEAKAIQRLEGDLAAQVCVGAQLQEGDLRPELAVDRHVPSGLAHEPGGRAGDGFAAQGAEQEGVVTVWHGGSLTTAPGGGWG